MKIRLRKYVESDLQVLIQILNENYNDYGDFDYAYEFVRYIEETFHSKVVQGHPTILVVERANIRNLHVIKAPHQKTDP